MAHKIEQFADGSAAFVSARTDAWHRLGTTLDTVFTAEEAMRVARLGGWNVRKSPLTTTVDGQTLTVPGAYATLRTHPETGKPDVLGCVGSQYTPVQNEELCGFLNALVDESGAHFETAGSLRKGREVFVTMWLPQTMTIAGTDELDLYIAALNSHDGSTPMRLLVTPVRIVCANTQTAALANTRSSWTLRHTSGASGRIEEARQALGLTWTYLEKFQAEAEKMIETQLTEGAFMDTVHRELWPLAENATDRQRANHARITGQLGALFADADTNADIRNTAWAGYQSVVEYLDHYAPVRGADGAETAVARAERVITQPNVAALKRTAFSAFAVTN
ncbi:DUF932 domain-containing protein [Salinactinospora qingdaonensis]|uniref:DUF932 domain-containing protein n=1 Tax=Salinactinospora qingdaonensis TaxID=702744 RepID=A0ABP7FBL0_9ACTN